MPRIVWILLALPAVGGCFLWYRGSDTTPPTQPVPVEGMNGAYDDFNAAAPWSVHGGVLFATNRGSRGADFDLWEAEIHVQDDRARSQEPTPSRLPGVNTPWNELGPTQHAGRLVFSSDRPGGLGGWDLYVSDLVQEARPIPERNTEANEGYMTFTEGRALFASDRGGQGWDLYELTWSGSNPFAGSLSRLDDLSTSSNETAPCFFRRDGRLWVIFASDRPGGAGGYDLWVSKLEGPRWEAPRPLSAVNTPSDEFRSAILSPEYYEDRLALLFSSNRPGGKGGYDQYVIGLESALGDHP